MIGKLQLVAECNACGSLLDGLERGLGYGVRPGEWPLVPGVPAGRCQIGAPKDRSSDRASGAVEVLPQNANRWAVSGV